MIAVSSTPFTSSRLLVKGALFDMDGLMLDTERLSAELYTPISAKLGWPTPQAVYSQTVGLNEHDSEQFYKARYGKDYPFKEIWDAVKAEVLIIGNAQGIPHRPGLLVVLDKFAALGVPLAVATSTGRERALWKLERAGILPRFTALAFGDEVTHSKPNPEIFLLAAERLGVPPEDCVGFEDSPAGLTALAAANIRSVFVKDMIEPPKEVLQTVWKRCADLAEAAGLF